MSEMLQRQVAQLKRRITELEGQLNARTPTTESSQEAVAQLERAEQLFAALVAANPMNLISYSRAYREVIGEYDEWRNAVHAPEIIRVARRTKPRTVSGLTIRLDALIVGKKTGTPATGHFSTAGYAEAVWNQKFGGHPLLS
jgi:hypothetical protein